MTVELNKDIFETELTEEQIAFRDFFVMELLKDFDAYAACLRTGVMATYASDIASQLMECGYVQRRIAQLTTTPKASTAEQEASDRAFTEANYRRLMRTGTVASQVAATNGYARIKGYDKDDSGGEDTLAVLSEFLAEFASRAPV